MAVVAFQSQDEIHDVVVVGRYLCRLEGFAATADDVILLCGSDGFSMRFDIVEVIAGNEQSRHIFRTIAQSAVLDAHLRTVEVLLTARPTVRRTIGDARVFAHVEALFRRRITDGG